MRFLSHWVREKRFLGRDKTALTAFAVLFLLSLISSVLGLQKVETQRQAIDAMIKADAADRAVAQAPLTNYGDAGYYSFYITYDPPSALAFAALGQRDTAPYMKRIRLLAIEGQIYQGDSPNPLLAQIGSLDLAFISGYILPLILIVLLYDMKAGERVAGRHLFLEALPGSKWGLWLPRITLRTGGAFLCVAIPLVVGAMMDGAEFTDILSAVLGVLGICLFWTVVAAFLANMQWRGATIASTLIGIWLVLNLIVPLAAQLFLVSQVDGPAGSDVALLQREAVNDAWDIPKAQTLKPFEALYPQYAVKDELAPFDWRWYFAFQTMGDVTAVDVSQAYRRAIIKRDAIAAKVAWLSPALAIQRHLQGLGKTGLQAQLSFDAAIRDYHQTLRDFYFPMIFENRDFSAETLSQYPRFDPQGQN